MISNEQAELLREKLNQKYDNLEKLDAQIDVLILKRNALLNEIESGVAMLLKYQKF